MRALFGCLAVLLGAVSVALAARYGYKGADTEVDGAISAVVFGLIAVCAFLFDAAAVRLWFMRFRTGALVVGAIAAAALLVTFTNSLGAIAGRSDATQADRTRAKDDAAADRVDLARIAKDRAALGAFTPATEDDAAAARAAVAAAERIRVAECEKRGPRCRERETDEQAKRADLATVLANKALTDKAAKLDADAGAVRGRITKAPAVQNANPLGAVLEQLIGAGSAALTAWQQAVVAAVFELCLVGVMVIYELLGQGSAIATAAAASPIKPRVVSRLRSWVVKVLGAWRLPGRPTGIAPPVYPPSGGSAVTAAQRPKIVATSPAASVRDYALERMLPADKRDNLDMVDLLEDYRRWCSAKGCAAHDLAGFADDMRDVCARAGIAIETKGKRVLVRGVRFGPANVAAKVGVISRVLVSTQPRAASDRQRE